MTLSLIVLQGPSASGKSTIQAMLGLPRLVTWTSRPPRAGETDGVDYEFKTRAEMQQLYEQGQMVEMTEYHGNLYGTPAHVVERLIQASELRSVILDEAGARRIKELFGDKALLVGIKADRHECERRLELRGQGAAEIAKRLASFEGEIAALSACDLIMNNSDENKRKIDHIVKWLRAGLGEYGV